jgi:hypothetical protein
MFGAKRKEYIEKLIEENKQLIAVHQHDVKEKERLEDKLKRQYEGYERLLRESKYSQELLVEQIKNTYEKKIAEVTRIIWQKDNKLKEQSNFYVHKTNNGQEWALVTAMCSIGGCEYKSKKFKSEREALENGVLLTIQGYKLDVSNACPSCYEEYMRDCI